MVDRKPQTVPAPKFKGSIVRFLHQLKDSGQPVALSINGQTELIVQDEQSYEMLLDLVDRIETIEAIREGLEDMKAGRTLSLDEVKEALR